MPAGAATGSPRRRRRDPAESELEILLAARSLLAERPFRELTVELVMSRTGLKRPAFYVHFADRHELVLRIVENIGGELTQAADGWLTASEPGEGELARTLSAVAHVYAANAPILRAVADAAVGDERVEAAYRGLVEGFVAAAGVRIAAEQRAGRTARDLDPAPTARALVWLNERYLYETLGRAAAPGPDEVAATLVRIWAATLYGAA